MHWVNSLPGHLSGLYHQAGGFLKRAIPIVVFLMGLQPAWAQLPLNRNAASAHEKKKFFPMPSFVKFTFGKEFLFPRGGLEAFYEVRDQGKIFGKRWPLRLRLWHQEYYPQGKPSTIAANRSRFGSIHAYSSAHSSQRHFARHSLLSRNENSVKVIDERIELQCSALPNTGLHVFYGLHFDFMKEGPLQTARQFGVGFSYEAPLPVKLSVAFASDSGLLDRAQVLLSLGVL
jgi:hypothetical protein